MRTADNRLARLVAECDELSLERAGLERQIRGFQIAGSLLLVVALVLGAGWVLERRTTGDERAAWTAATKAVADWREVLVRAAAVRPSDADLVAANVDPAGLYIRFLVDSVHRMGTEHSIDGKVGIRYEPDSMQLAPDGTVHVHAFFVYWYAFDVPSGDANNESSGAEGRYLTFVPTEEGALRLVQDVGDGNGHGGVTPNGPRAHDH